MDLPPSAIAPVYKEKVYVKALRIPKNINLKFKHDDYFSKKKAENKNINKNTDLFSSSKEDDTNNVNETNKFNSIGNNTKPSSEKGNNKSNSIEDKNLTKNKSNNPNDLINETSKKEKENKRILSRKKIMILVLPLPIVFRILLHELYLIINIYLNFK